MSAPILPGAEPWSHEGSRPHGALCVHGFTGSPWSLRGVAEAFAAAGYHVELPRLAGHGTSIEDMLTTGWSDWTASVEEAYQRLRERVDAVVVVGQSMGGTLSLWLAAQHPEIAGVVCVNPATQPQPDDVMEMVRDMVAAGELLLPGGESDIAKPGVTSVAYRETPLPCVVSMSDEGTGPMLDRYAAIDAPLLLMTSPQDHVIDPAQSDALAAVYGWPVERITLERSFHVATEDYDAEVVETAAVDFADKIVGG